MRGLMFSVQNLQNASLYSDFSTLYLSAVFPRMSKWRRLGRIVYAIIPFILAGALIITSLHFFAFTTDTEYIGGSWGDDTIIVHPNQTYTYNVTMLYVKNPSGIFLENGSIVIEENILDNSFTSWTRVWLPISILLNDNFSGDCFMYGKLELPNGVVQQLLAIDETGGGAGTGFNAEVTHGGTVRVIVENSASMDANVSISWKTDFHFFNRPYFDYGFVALGIGLLFPVAFLIKQIDARRMENQ